MLQLSREERLLKIDGMTNVRDIGGYETQDGYYTKSKKYVRSTNPHDISEESKEALYEYGIRTVIDLRSEYEQQLQPHGLKGYKDVTYININILQGNDVSLIPKNISEYSDLAGFYIYMIEANKDMFKKLFQTFLKHNDDGCIMFNCSAGKDRTGVTAALLLDLANCYEYDIVKDYSESYENNLSIITELEKMVDSVEQKYLGSAPEMMMKFLDYVDNTYGSAKGYLASCGLSEEEILDLKDNFVI